MKEVHIKNNAWRRNYTIMMALIGYVVIIAIILHKTANNQHKINLKTEATDYRYGCKSTFFPSAQPKVYDCRFCLFFSALSFEVWNYWKVDFLGKNWLPQENLTPSGKVVFLDKSWLPWEKLTSSGKVDSLGKSWVPREKMTPSEKWTPAGKIDSLGKSWLPQEKLTSWEHNKMTLEKHCRRRFWRTFPSCFFLFLIHWRSLSTCSLGTFYRLVHIFCWNQWGTGI